jgi:hypothetical protein
VVACPQPLDSRARLNDDPGGLMAEDERQRLGNRAVDHV